jgi:D-alanyl-lipoteichoic acid acyltransferase DltB (MBOAT superfamily)
MLFQTREFAIYFACVLVLYFFRAPRWRWFLVAPALAALLLGGQTAYAAVFLVVLACDLYLCRQLRDFELPAQKRLVCMLSNLAVQGGLVAIVLANGYFTAVCEQVLPAELSALALPMMREAVLLYIAFAVAYTVQVYIGRHSVDQHLGWMVLLPVSYYFYMSWHAWYAFLILYSTLVDYWVGLEMQRARSQAHRKFLLAGNLLKISLVGNFALLFYFKYHNFFVGSVNEIVGSRMFAVHHWLLPVGISFYTFQTLSYSFDVYRGKVPAERHLGYFATYVIYFPQLVAGPIERPQNLLPELRHGIQGFDYERIAGGAKLFLWGLFKKIVVADRLATFVDPVYDYSEYNPHLVALATFAFGIQIYCDFSGYTDMAIGSSRILGIGLMKNFRAPYRAESIQEFWQRWHISLSTWFKDYVYKPICTRWGFTTKVKLLAACTVFLLSGLWHGANWTFVVWGAIFAVFYSVERLAAPWSTAVGDAIFGRHKWLRRHMNILRTYLIVNFAWIFFRADSLSTALGIVRRLPESMQAFLEPIKTLSDLSRFGIGWFEIIAAFVGLATLWTAHSIQERHGSALGWLARRPWIVRQLIYHVILCCIFLGVSKSVPFIYFQF